MDHLWQINVAKLLIIIYSLVCLKICSFHLTEYLPVLMQNKTLCKIFFTW